MVKQNANARFDSGASGAADVKQPGHRSLSEATLRPHRLHTCNAKEDAGA
jgi:hypothetical protein